MFLWILAARLGTVAVLYRSMIALRNYLQAACATLPRMSIVYVRSGSAALGRIVGISQLLVAEGQKSLCDIEQPLLCTIHTHQSFSAETHADRCTKLGWLLIQSLFILSECRPSRAWYSLIVLGLPSCFAEREFQSSIWHKMLSCPTC